MEELLQQILNKLEDLSRGQQAQNQRLQRLEDGQEALRTEVAGLQAGQEALQNRLVALGVRLENEVFEKIRALFDARQVHLDYFESLRDALSRVEENLDHLIRRERQQDIRLDEHEREIRLLRLRK